MRKLPAPKADFASYVNRPDTHFIEREAHDSLEDLYTQGYLPYSSSKGLHNIFYSARSARVVLPKFSVSSENRRIAKKFDGSFTKTRTPSVAFRTDEAFYAFMLCYFTKRHGQNVMPRERLQLLLKSGLITTVIEYKNNGTVVAYVLEVESGSMRHFWYSAYDVSLAQQSLGLWLMLDCVRDAAAAGFTYYYLGTVYGPKALYKTNFAPLEWWDESKWSFDLAQLKLASRAE